METQKSSSLKEWVFSILFILFFLILNSDTILYMNFSDDKIYHLSTFMYFFSH